MTKITNVLASLGLAGLIVVPAAADTDLTTLAERTGYRQTGRYGEVERLCAAYAARWPRQVRCFEFGRTPQGRPMLAIAASADGVLDPVAARAAGRPVLLFQGGIHAGEIDGKDAGFLALRELLAGEALPGALERVTWLFVPVFNVDGHERFGPWHRPNQRGPEEMGWRTTSQGLNLNRDYTKAEAPEMRAMLALLGHWDPVLYVDLHVTDGAKFRHVLSVEVEPVHGWDPALARLGADIKQAVLQRLDDRGFHPLPFYPSFVRSNRPDSGFAVWVPSARYSTGYWASRNRFAVLVETHSWQDYPLRVRATYETVLALTEFAARDGARWLAAVRDADRRATALGGKPVALRWAATAESRTIDFLGYQYTILPSEVSGADWIRYDETQPETWRVPLRDRIEPALTRTAPQAGYLVPPEYADQVAAALAPHRIRFRRLTQPRAGAAAAEFRATQVTRAAAPLEGQMLLSVRGDWQPTVRDVAAGALYVPVAQPAARLVMSLLEPDAPDSLLSWGLFANHFERKEYAEAYLLEEFAREMLAADEALAAEFAERLASDAAFAGSPAERLQFFARRHPSWDAQLNLYPVLRVEAWEGEEGNGD